MATGPYFDKRRGTWRVAWNDGTGDRRPVVGHQPHWKPGDRRPLSPPPEVAAAYLAYKKKEKEAEATGLAGPAPSVAAFLADYRARMLGDWQPRTVEGFDRVARCFAAWCEANGVRTARDLDGERCRAWAADRVAGACPGLGPVEPITAQKERLCLKAAWAAVPGMANPWFDAPIRVRSDAPPKGSWSPGEYAQLLAECRPWLRDLIVLGCHTGIRATALVSLEWRHVDEARGFVRVPRALDKAGKGYELPMHARVREVLGRRRGAMREGEPRILDRGPGKARADRDTASRPIVAACKRAGLPAPSGPNHQCRRTFGRWAVLGHLTGTPVPMYVVQRWMGHASISMTQKYLDMGDEDSSRFMEST